MFRGPLGVEELEIALPQTLDEGDKGDLAIDLGNVAQQQLSIGALRAAEANQRRSIALCREIKDESNEAVGHQELGRVLSYRGAYPESETELRMSTSFWKTTNDVQGQCLDEAYRALCELIRLRQAVCDRKRKSRLPDATSALAPARRTRG